MSAPMPRDPSGFMTYPNDCVVGILDAAAAGRPFGPNGMGEWMWPVTAVYDPTTNTTRVGFTLVPPHEEEVSA